MIFTLNLCPIFLFVSVLCAAEVHRVPSSDHSLVCFVCHPVRTSVRPSIHPSIHPSSSICLTHNQRCAVFFSFSFFSLHILHSVYSKSFKDSSREITPKIITKYLGVRAELRKTNKQTNKKVGFEDWLVVFLQVLMQRLLWSY